MATPTRGKVRLDEVTRKEGPREELRFRAVDEAEWSEHTPQGELTITIENEDLIGQFNPGEKYFLDLTPVEE